MTTENLEHWHFGYAEEMANGLLQLVLAGKKRATSCSQLGLALDGDAVPQVGELSVITFWNGTAGCLIKTTNVRVLAFKDITFDLAKLEGEDETLMSWRETHARFFTAEGEEMGYTFTEDMPVVFEEFEVVEVL